jgi:hypothetical protein
MRNNSQSKLCEPVARSGNVSGVIDAILEVGRQRKSLLAQLRAALQSGDDSQALVFARQLCGLVHEESNRINSRIN